MEQHEIIRRYATQEDYQQLVPLSVIWEITLACNLSCRHCGSRAGKVRSNELSIEECFEIIEQLKRLGTREIGIIGGEAFLKKDWLKIVEKITLEGIDCSMQTGGFHLTEEKIIQAKEAGIKNIGVSIDGLEQVHDYIRGKPSSFREAINCLNFLSKNGVPSSVNTTVTNINKEQLDDLLDIFISYNVTNWQIQLAVAMGNAVDNDDLLIQPCETKDIIDRIANMYTKALANNLLIQPGNNIGYFGPHEHRWRTGNFGHYTGCTAGHTAIGIEADGTIKGCPSLPSKEYGGGNIRDKTIEDIWKNSPQLAFTRNRSGSDLWGFCKTCYYSSVCLAGCTWTGHVLFGKRGNNPYCYHRVTELAKQGKKEKIRKVKSAKGLPFDYGLFELVVEDANGQIIEVQESDENHTFSSVTGETRNISKLQLCKGCYNYIFTDTAICPFCSEDVAEKELQYNINMENAQLAFQRVLEVMKLPEG